MSGRVITLNPAAGAQQEEMLRDVARQAYKNAYDETVGAVMDLVKGTARKVQIAQSILLAKCPSLFDIEWDEEKDADIPVCRPSETFALAVDGAFRLAEVFISRAQAEIDAMGVLADARLAPVADGLAGQQEGVQEPASEPIAGSATAAPQGDQ